MNFCGKNIKTVKITNEIIIIFSVKSKKIRKINNINISTKKRKLFFFNFYYYIILRILMIVTI
jgi:hypothetical protein